MRIGSSIGLIAVGLILALAIHLRLGVIDLALVGWILVVVGVIGLVVSLAMARRHLSTFVSSTASENVPAHRHPGGRRAARKCAQ